MEKIKISQQLRDVFMQPFDITRTDLEKTLKEPDDVQKLEFGGLGINLYMKTDPVSRPPLTFIVTESKKEDSENTIDMVFKTYLEPLGVDKNTMPSHQTFGEAKPANGLSQLTIKLDHLCN